MIFYCLQNEGECFAPCGLQDSLWATRLIRTYRTKRFRRLLKPYRRPRKRAQTPTPRSRCTYADNVEMLREHLKTRRHLPLWITMTTAAMMLVMLPSLIELHARSNPCMMASRSLLPFSSSSLIRSKISTLASTAIPSDRTNPAIPAAVRTTGMTLKDYNEYDEQ